MIKVAQILLRAYLWRNPINVRLSQFNYLSRYSWLKNILEELRPKIFPQRSLPQPPTAKLPIAWFAVPQNEVKLVVAENLVSTLSRNSESRS